MIPKLGICGVKLSFSSFVNGDELERGKQQCSDWRVAKRSPTAQNTVASMGAGLCSDYVGLEIACALSWAVAHIKCLVPSAA